VDIAELEQLARANHGAIHRTHAEATEHEWYHAHRTGLLAPLHQNVSRLAGTFDTPELRIAAAVLAAGPAVIASHRSAAHLWGIPRSADDPVDVIVPARGAARRYDGVVVHRPNDQQRLVPWRRLDIPCTSLERTLLDLGAVDRWAVRGAVGHVLAANMSTLAHLQRVLIEHSERGRHGIVALRSAVDGWSIDGRPADSVLEIAMRRLAARAGLPPLEFHARIEGWEVDFRVVGTRVVIECDGWMHHGLDHDQFERDRRRDAELAAAGWITLRFTYRSIIRAPGATAARIRAAVERWASAA
jgi:very-short-patch-repair endonuclease